MPRYFFRRRDTGELVEQFVPAKRVNRSGVPKTVTVAGEHGRVVADFEPGAHLDSIGVPPPSAYPRTLESLGCMPNQIETMRKRFPHHDYTPEGAMVVRSRRHMERCAKDVGGLEG